MRRFHGHLFQLSLFALLGGGLIAGTAGCRSLTPQAAVNLQEAGWTVRQGQAVWRSQREAPEIAGDLLVAMHLDGRSLAQFTKPPFPFVVAQRSSTGWQAEFPAQNRSYSGRGKAPDRIIWLHLPEALVGRSEPGPWRFESLGAGTWRFENPATGERVEGFLHTTSLPKTHQVQPGEDLSMVSQWYGIALSTLREANAGPDSNWFRPGHSIQLPPAGPTP